MGVSLLAVAFEVGDPGAVARFWSDLLDRPVTQDEGLFLLEGSSTQVGLGFVSGETDWEGPHRIHLHLTSTSDDDQQRLVGQALSLGARHLDVGQGPDERHVVMADPGRNEFCVIEPESTFLAHCGFLGEVACDGRRAVGVFWSGVLGWPLVWDHDGETAIQAPSGGTKIAWGGATTAPAGRYRRQRFVLSVDPSDRADEGERMVRLGATPVDQRTLLDPEGYEIRLVDR